MNDQHGIIPMGSMYGIFTCIYNPMQVNIPYMDPRGLNINMFGLFFLLEPWSTFAWCTRVDNDV